MRHLYSAASESGVSYLIDKAKTYERRRCDHRPEDYPEPLSTKECLASVVDPKSNKTNKHRYVVASQELEVRKHMRTIMGTPLVYINRSVMIMEPMAGATAENREREERGKFRAGLKRGTPRGNLKRKREDDDDEGKEQAEGRGEDRAVVKKKKLAKGPKGPNPLAVKKSKKKAEGEGVTTSAKPTDSKKDYEAEESNPGQIKAEAGRKRKRKHKSRGGAVPTDVDVKEE
jgi:U3 small nucleolar RNA-associated protein 23